MEQLFSFDPSKTKVDIALAFSYTPKILKNHITLRRCSGLLYILEGAYEYSWQGGSFFADAGSLIYLPPNSVPYSYSITFPPELLGAKTMQIEFELRDIKTDACVSYADHPTLVFENAHFLKERFIAVVNAFTKSETVSNLQLYASLFSLFSACTEENRSVPKNAEKIAPAVKYLNENYTKDLDVKALCDLCYISESQLTRLFKKHLGISPVAYRNRLRVNAAKKLLENPELSVGEISDMLGFYDIYAFSHFFSTATGTSPTKYRKL